MKPSENEEIIDTKLTEKLNEKELNFINIRINNTFVEANKSYKQLMIEDYEKFLKKVDKIYKNMLVDSVIEVASDKYAIIVFEHEATANVGNSNILNIEEQFNNIINKNIKFVCISKDYWKNVAEEFKKNKKNKVKYEYIDEIEDNSNNIFDTSIVEVI